MRTVNTFSLATLLALSATPAIAQDGPDNILAERRLRACLMGGSAGAPTTSLMAAVIAVRSLCRIQIDRLRDERLLEVDARFGSPDTPLSASQRNARDKARAAATRLLDDEVVVAVSNFTGLTQ